MQPREIHFKGTLRYDSREALEQAMLAARTHLAEDADEDADAAERSLASLRALSARGTRLSIDLRMPSGPAMQFAAAAMFEALASRAASGAVEARAGDRAVDVYAPGGDD